MSAPAPTIRVAVRAETFDVAAETAAITGGSRRIGAVVSFLGLCRDEAGSLRALEIEHFPGMAEDELRRIAADAAARWHLHAMTIIHRHGTIPVGDPIVLVLAASTHREAAFHAAQFVMDFLKTDAPFWKKELPADGSQSRWVAAHTKDDAQRQQWAEGAAEGLTFGRDKGRAS